MTFTYVLSGHTLADNLRVFIDKDVRARFVSVHTASGRGSHEGAGLLEHVSGNKLGQHYDLYQLILLLLNIYLY